VNGASRRAFLRLAGAGAAALAVPGCSERGGRVVVIGAGFGGATAAKYLRRLAPGVAVTLVEPRASYWCCPFSNAVIGDLEPLAILQQGYAALAGAHGIELVRDRATDLEIDERSVRLAGGRRLRWDRLVLAPGIRLRWGAPEGYDESAAERMPHAWQAGPQTALLRRRLQALGDGAVVAISVPRAPFRCPPGPYERASLMAAWLHQHNPRAKVLVLDANERFSKQALFEQAWATLYPGMVERIPLSADGAVRRVDPNAGTVHTELSDYRVDLANVIPPQAAAAIAERAGLTDGSGWCPVDPAGFESTRVPGVHVIGDACLAGAMPRSASAANSQAKVCALAVAAYFTGTEPPPASLHNTCYSLVAADYGISVSMIYRVSDGAIAAVEGAGGLSALDADGRVRAAEARFARGWFDSIRADSFGV